MELICLLCDKHLAKVNSKEWDQSVGSCVRAESVHIRYCPCVHRAIKCKGALTICSSPAWRKQEAQRRDTVEEIPNNLERHYTDEAAGKLNLGSAAGGTGIGRCEGNASDELCETTSLVQEEKREQGWGSENLSLQTFAAFQIHLHSQKCVEGWGELGKRTS